MAVMRASVPGTSRALTATRTSRPDRTSPRPMICASSCGSMLPPDSTSPTFCPRNRSGYRSSAASPAAPAPSASVFSISSSSTMACSMSPSSTSSRSSTRWRTTSAHSLPGVATAMPSAMVLAPMGCCVPCTAFTMPAKRATCTPVTRMRGDSALAAVAMPPISPPPPTETTSASRSGTARSISSATVPWPAMMASSS